MRKLSLYFTAGCAGALANSLIVWLFGSLGIAASLGVSIAPRLSPAWLYPRIVWGGLWGMLYFLPMLNNKLISKGLILSIGPTLIQLLVVFPLKAHKGYLGLELGVLTPIMVIFYNAVWGIVASLYLRFSTR